ncbi:TetR/AcrR family transcriptional regulator [Cytobacillus kochii]|uniref:TetR/AcrR family transcriptional regulator n=1 Tax=Cytobacillus kochii TaxID=859143 RepID=UPI001CD22450|nr:TetR/AcrR family transcriptional regulator [Cytobacillus kochii]MCA1027374.1 TetR/AcrR family transcriptional regulator [Cytobacillus kochii]
MAVDRKQLIIQAATKSFSLFGYKATTMEQVAKIANVGKGTIYTFFKNKEELFDEIITALIREMKIEAEQVLSSDLSLQENLHLALYRILEYRLEHQLTIKLFQEGKEMGTTAVIEMTNKIEREIISYIGEKVKTLGIDKGEIEPCDPELTAFIMLKLYISLIFDWERQHAPLSKSEIAELMERYVFKGLIKS